MKVPETFYSMTLQEVGDVLGMTKQAVADTEKRAIRKLGNFQFRRLLEMRAMAQELRRSADVRAECASQ